MDESLRSLVRERAGDCCEYCGLPQAALPFARFHIDHIIAEQHGGTNDLENLAYCCSRCNFSKGPNLSGIDPVDGEIVTLFNPRTQQWSDHFKQRGGEILGLTPAGRATVRVLGMNERRRVQLRRSLR